MGELRAIWDVFVIFMVTGQDGCAQIRKALTLVLVWLDWRLDCRACP